MPAGGTGEGTPPPRRIGCSRRMACAACAIMLALCVAQPAPDARAQTGGAFGGLPPPPRALPVTEDAVLLLELVVNHRPSGRIAPVSVRGGVYYVAAGELRAAGLPVPETEAADALVDPASMPGVSVSYEASSLRLMIQAPPSWLPMQRIGRDRLYDYEPARSSFGGLLNYDLYAAFPRRGESSASLWNEARLFGGFGVLSSTGIFRTGAGPDGFRRYDTVWRLSDEQRMRTYAAGDLTAGALAWSSAVRLGGVQVSRDFSVRPDIVTYPLPQFSGEAAAPGAVDLFINSWRAAGAEIGPGPFTLTSIPFITGAGEAVVTVTDALGRQVSTTIPFYVSNDLLAPGLSDFSLAAGLVRRDYGLRDFSYRGAAASASFRHGLSDFLTLEAQGEAGESFGLAGLGGVLRAGRLGVLSASYSHGFLDGRDGGQWSAAYQYSRRGFGLAVRHTERSGDFADLSVYADPARRLPASATSLHVSAALAGLGSLGAGYFDTLARDGARVRLANLSWSLPVFGAANLHASANHELEGKDWSAGVQITMPLGRGRGSASAGVETRRGGEALWRASASRAAPMRGGLGWSLAYAGSAGAAPYYQADVSLRGDRAEFRGGVHGRGGDYTAWGQASGALAVLDGSVFAANRIPDAFVVVSTNGQAGVPVRYENQEVGVTNRNGHVLVPWASSYYRARYEIDPLGLPPDIQTPVTEQRVAVRRGSGYVLDFPMRQVRSARVVLHGADGAPLPVGAVIALNEDAVAYVGWDGFAYLEGVRDDNTLHVSLPDGGGCMASFSFAPGADPLARIGPLSCRAETAI